MNTNHRVASRALGVTRATFAEASGLTIACLKMRNAPRAWPALHSSEWRNWQVLPPRIAREMGHPDATVARRSSYKNGRCSRDCAASVARPYPADGTRSIVGGTSKGAGRFRSEPQRTITSSPLNRLLARGVRDPMIPTLQSDGLSSHRPNAKFSSCTRSAFTRRPSMVGRQSNGFSLSRTNAHPRDCGETRRSSPIRLTFGKL